MVPLSAFEKAKIIPFDENGNESKEEIRVLFNPEQYSVSKGNQFAAIAIPGRNNPIIQFIKGDAETLSVELLFDTHTEDGDADADEKYFERISKLLRIDPALHAPPVCVFQWGKLKFKGVIEKIDKKFTMFNKSGNPVRGTVAISFKQYHQPEPPLQSPDRTKIRMIKEGDSLWLLSAREYGTPDKWKEIARANNIENPLDVEPGTQVIVPPLD